MGCSSLQPAWYREGETLLDLSATSSASSCGLGWIVKRDSGRKIVYSAATFNIQNTNAQLLEARVVLSKDKKGTEELLVCYLKSLYADRISFPKISEATGQQVRTPAGVFPTN